MNKAERICMMLPQLRTAPAFRLANIIRRHSVAVNYVGLGRYDELFVLRDGSVIRWDDGGFHPERT